MKHSKNRLLFCSYTSLLVNLNRGVDKFGNEVNFRTLKQGYFMFGCGRETVFKEKPNMPEAIIMGIVERAERKGRVLWIKDILKDKGEHEGMNIIQNFLLDRGYEVKLIPEEQGLEHHYSYSRMCEALESVTGLKGSW